MHHLIQHQVHTISLLTAHARKRSIKHKLLSIVTGIATLRLGQHEYIIQAGQSVWLPFDCLYATTYFPDTQIIEISLSARAQAHYPSQAGYITVSPLLSEVLSHLTHNPFNDKDPEQAALLRFLSFHFTQLAPSIGSQALLLEQAHTLEGLNQNWFQQGLQVRQAQKYAASGMKVADIIQQVFAGDAQQAQQVFALFLNDTQPF